jgi:uncharacterized iron-regulated membrane protein
MGFTGGMVSLRPQISTLLSPAAALVANCQAPTDWNRAARDISAFAHSEIDRVYGPYGSDTRYQFRMTGDQPAVYKHVIYDACAGRILGSINLGWMDWTVDLHHNLLSGKTGRRWAGAIGVAFLLSSLSGLLLWLLSKPNLRTAFRVQRRFSRRTPRELHRAFGVGAACLLALEAFTGIWLCFPQTMRAALAQVAPAPEDVRPAKGRRDAASTERAGLNELMIAAHTALPDGLVREIRLPEGNGPVQVRMWQPGDFRSLGNNVVFLSSSKAQVLGVDRYADRSGSNRFVQAMAGLHYDDWGGLPFRMLCAAAGFLTPVLFVTGFLIWWYARPRKKSSIQGQAALAPEAVQAR